MILVSSMPNGQHQQSPLDDPGSNPAFTMRRHLLHAKEDCMQIDQMKKVTKRFGFDYRSQFPIISFLDDRRTCQSYIAR